MPLYLVKYNILLCFQLKFRSSLRLILRKVDFSKLLYKIEQNLIESYLRGVFIKSRITPNSCGKVFSF